MVVIVLVTENMTMEVDGHSLVQNQQEQMLLCVFSCCSDIHILRKPCTAQNNGSVLIFASSRAVLLVISRGKTQVLMRSDHLSPCLFVIWIAVSRAP